MPFKQRLLFAVGGSTTFTLCGLCIFLASRYFHLIRIIATLSICMILGGLIATFVLFLYYIKVKWSLLRNEKREMTVKWEPVFSFWAFLAVLTGVELLVIQFTSQVQTSSRAGARGFALLIKRKRFSMKQTNRKRTKLLLFNAFVTGAPLLIFLIVVFKVLPPIFIFLAVAMCIVVVALAINILLEKYRNRHDGWLFNEGEDFMGDLEMQPCPECGGRRVWVAYLYNAGVSLTQPGRSTFLRRRKNSTKTNALTCTVCGYTSIYASQPGNLIPDDWIWFFQRGALEEYLKQSE
jgi:hypothetical protein